MTAFRRTRYNFSLQRAVDWARELGKPLVILEALRSDYCWASDRMHHFVVQGMADNAVALDSRAVHYFPYLEPQRGAGNGLLVALAKQACVVVGDDYPGFFLPNMIRAAGKTMCVRLEVVDSNGLLPMRAVDRVFSRAVDFRRYLQRNLLPHLFEGPKSNPLARVKLPQLDELPRSAVHRWPPADVGQLAQAHDWLNNMPIDHQVGVAPTSGGCRAAERRLRRFLDRGLANYAADCNSLNLDVTSGLSPHLHFGHLASHQVFSEVTRRVGWTPANVADRADGSRTGWWGADTNLNAFLDQLITWRELGFNMAWQRADYDRYESLPDWSKKTLASHARDRRSHVYDLACFEHAETHDPLWNAAQRQLIRKAPYTAT